MRQLPSLRPRPMRTPAQSAPTEQEKHEQLLVALNPVDRRIEPATKSPGTPPAPLFTAADAAQRAQFRQATPARVIRGCWTHPQAARSHHAQQEAGADSTDVGRSSCPFSSPSSISSGTVASPCDDDGHLDGLLPDRLRESSVISASPGRRPAAVALALWRLLLCAGTSVLPATSAGLR